MYNNSRQRNGFRRPQNNYHAQHGNVRRPARPIRKLDPNLFIKKRNNVDTEQVIYESSARFSDYNIVDKIKQNIAEHNYLIPTPIQEKAIPHILEGKDVIGLANTGTGKTAAFLITLINKSFLDRNQRTLIVVPTRELAVQIADEFKRFAKGMNLEVVAAIGGASLYRQTYALRHRPHFVIGTPGRIMDLIERNILDLKLFQNIVLDEVDRMVDIGFIKDIQHIISLLPKIRQSLFFSATIDQRTEEILQTFVTDPVTVSVKEKNSVNTIDQDIIKPKNNMPKIDTLHDLLIQPEFEKVMIFGRTKWGMEKLTTALIERGFKAAAIHGNKSQNQRQRTLQQFKNNQINILIATDVASRGIDIDNVTHVINYDAPETYDDYIHRIGRTGRAGKFGVALTFVE